MAGLRVLAVDVDEVAGSSTGDDVAGGRAIEGEQVVVSLAALEGVYGGVVAHRAVDQHVAARPA